MITSLETESGVPADLVEGALAKAETLSANPASYLVTGTSALGIGLVVERGLGFLANLLAARMGGAGTFGSYSFAIATANNIGTYAAGGIGATATRFSGKYPIGTSGYPTLARVLFLVSMISAALAAAILWLGSVPLAHLLHQPNLTGLLHWAAFSAAGMILLECSRGFFVGQRRLAAIVLLSVLTGVGMISLLPTISHFGPVAMVCSQGCVTLLAVGVCFAFYRPLGLSSPVAIARPKPAGPILREVWSFTLVQLAGVIGMNAAGYWLTSLVAQADSTMAQMSFYAIGNQLRNMVALAPSLLSQSSLAVMAEPEPIETERVKPALAKLKHGELEQADSRILPARMTPDRIMAVCTFIATVASLSFAGVGIAIAPWALTHLYGKSYGGAATATALSLATAVVHMGNAPAAGRLTIISIQMTGVINSIWAGVVAAAACLFLVVPGSAALAAAVILGAHLLSAVLVLITLRVKSSVPAGMVPLLLTAAATGVGMAILSVIRDQQGDRNFGLSAMLWLTLFVGLASIFGLGRRHGWMPSLVSLRAQLETRMLPVFGRMTGRRG